MKIAGEGLVSITVLVLLTLVTACFSVWGASLLAVLTAFVLWFYRDPDRIAPAGDGNLLSPADGRVVEIVEAEHPFSGAAVKVGIFMNVFSVHVNRVPCEGTVEFIEYVPGKKVAAFAPKASEINERNLVGLSTQYGPILLVQIAGLLARRIVCRVKKGDHFAAGNRYGMIKLGSKVDIYLPKSVELNVKIGDQVYSGKSVLGVMKK